MLGIAAEGSPGLKSGPRLASRLAGLVFALLAILAFVGYMPAPVEAHTMTFLSQSFMQPCLSPGASISYAFYGNQGPSDKTWVIRVLFGLYWSNSQAHETDAIQDMRFEVWMIDRSQTVTIAEYREGDWEFQSTNGPYTRGGTLTAHSGGTFDFTGVVYNVQTYGKIQCFTLWVRAAYM